MSFPSFPSFPSFTSFPPSQPRDSSTQPPPIPAPDPPTEPPKDRRSSRHSPPPSPSSEYSLISSDGEEDRERLRRFTADTYGDSALDSRPRAKDRGSKRLREDRDRSRDRQRKGKKKGSSKKRRKEKHVSGPFLVSLVKRFAELSTFESDEHIHYVPKGDEIFDSKGQVWIEQPKLYYTDRRGDENNLLFENAGEQSRNAPVYKRYGDTILGGSPAWKVDHRRSKSGKGVMLTRAGNFGGRSTPYGRYHTEKDLLKGGKVINMKKYAWIRDGHHLPPRPSSAIREFLTFSFPSRDEVLGDFIGFPDMAVLMGEKGLDVQALLIDPAVEAVIEEDADFVRRSGELHKMTQADRKNVRLWKQFIGLQDELVKEGEGKSSLKRSVAERKQAIYEKALVELPDNVELLEGYMKCCEETWE
ncbi:hypothetical protein BDK51DRAFT_37056 [Blyttiomyces helicus]|uniref:Uncharacterized protein n=1 Tax=Blyttiomyces helicus TaxID=388810 RepID=A0A4V1IS63_9FUNG|nr:hypothetical protein BDK51DRAFT_37056 [Blyttiomyces helicus]|eukprot:RKO92457.1 hypothetical protein BDK51DRAFT_37056 [Blyttiomyces helicus]